MILEIAVFLLSIATVLNAISIKRLSEVIL